MNANEVPEIITGTLAPIAGNVTPEVSGLAALIKKRARDSANHIVRDLPTPYGDPVGRLVSALVALEKVTGGIGDVARDNARASSGLNEAGQFGQIAGDVAIYEKYLGIVRGDENTTQAEIVAGALPTLIQVAARLEKESLNLDAKAAIFTFIGEFVGRLASDAEFSDQLDKDTFAIAVPTEITAFNRWIISHRIYGLANRWAAEKVSLAAAAIRSDDLKVAADALASANMAVATITAAMLYGSELSALQYATQVRPTMHPPLVEIELSGRMNLDHATYRRELSKLIAAVSNGALPDDPEVLSGLERVLHRDIQDMTSHVELTYRLVGSAPAIDEVETGSAVQELRGRLMERIHSYSPMLSVGRRTTINIHIGS